MVRTFRNYIVKEDMFSQKERKMLTDPNFKKLYKLFDKYGYELLVAVNRSYGTVIEVRPNDYSMPKIYFDKYGNNKSINGFTVTPVSYTISNKKDLDNYAKWAKDVNDLMAELSKWDFEKMLPFED